MSFETEIDFYYSFTVLFVDSKIRYIFSGKVTDVSLTGLLGHTYNKIPFINYNFPVSFTI